MSTKAPASSPTAGTLSTGSTYAASLVVTVTLVSLGAYAGLLPSNSEWRLFSYHPLLMSLGVACFVVGALVKKMGGYANTKMHGIISVVGVVSYFSGYAIIYTCKENGGKEHLTSDHSYYGVATLLFAVNLMIVGAVGLHPDFGFIKTNKLVGKIHKMGGRAATLLAFATMYSGLSDKLVGASGPEIRMVFGGVYVLTALLLFV